jgi:hypothetical protein
MQSQEVGEADFDSWPRESLRVADTIHNGEVICFVSASVEATQQVTQSPLDYPSPEGLLACLYGSTCLCAQQSSGDAFGKHYIVSRP